MTKELRQKQKIRKRSYGRRYDGGQGGGVLWRRWKWRETGLLGKYDGSRWFPRRSTMTEEKHGVAMEDRGEAWHRDGEQQRSTVKLKTQVDDGGEQRRKKMRTERMCACLEKKTRALGHVVCPGWLRCFGQLSESRWVGDVKPSMKWADWEQRHVSSAQTFEKIKEGCKLGRCIAKNQLIPTIHSLHRTGYQSPSRVLSGKGRTEKLNPFRWLGENSFCIKINSIDNFKQKLGCYFFWQFIWWYFRY